MGNIDCERDSMERVPETALIMDNLKDLKDALHEQSSRMKALEKGFVAMAVHNERISSTQAQVDAIWKRMDEYWGPKGAITRIQSHQAKCPKDMLEGQVIRLWWAWGIAMTLFCTSIVVLISK